MPSHRRLALSISIGVLLSLPLLSAQKLPWRAKEGDLLGDVTRVLLVPPDVRVEKWTATSGRELEGTSDHVLRTICGELDEVLEQRKIQVSDFSLCLGEGEASRERIEALRAVRSHFRELVTAWSKPGHHDDLLQSFHLGDELPEVNKLDADVLILVTADGTLTTKGEKAMEMVGGITGGPGQGLMIHLGVIRPRTGELLFFSEKNVGGDFLKHEDRLEKAIQKAVQSAFAASSAAPGTAAAQAPPSTEVAPAPQSVPAKRIRVAARVAQQKLLKWVNPKLPPDLAGERIQGIVRLHIIIAMDGTVKQVEPISGDPKLIPPSVEAVRQWLYKPTLLNGEPIEVDTTVDIIYTLGER
jgi:Gram-negative bacterial TonB protein C-terminal